MHRIQYPLDGKSYEETESRVRTIQKIYYEFFVGKKTPEQLYQNPDYRTVMDGEEMYKKGNNDMWGRHWRFWQQIDSLNLAESWSKTQCPVLSIFGEADFIQCSAVESYLIAETVNKSHPGNGKDLHIPDIDHLMVRNKDMKEAHKNFGNREYMLNNFNPKIAEETIKWMDSLKSKSN
jgi:pimeloyl-ACP methyl ester carboxylesterase